MELFGSATGITDYVNTVLAFWLAFYLLTRVRSNRNARGIIILMLALGSYYFINIVYPAGAPRNIRTLLILLTLVAGQHLSLALLPAQQRRSLAWQTTVAGAGGALIAIYIFAFPGMGSSDRDYIFVSDLFSQYGLIGVFNTFVSLLIANNLRLSVVSESMPINPEFIVGLISGLGTIAYALVGYLLQVPLPRYISSILIVITLSLIGYSIARHQIFVDRRIMEKDLPVSFFSMLILVLRYLLAAAVYDISEAAVGVFTILLIGSHVFYGWIREGMQRDLTRSDLHYEREIQHMARITSREEGLDQTMQRGLVLLLHHMQIQRGFIAIRKANQYVVVASIESLKIG